VSSPRISIVTPSYNQARYIRETIESVLAQSYRNVEHIVVDGLSTDQTPLILDGYPHLKVIREKDRGQADAINKGFRVANGDVFAYLNSDDTLLPGALERVAAEIAPARGRHVVMGRCRFVDERGRFSGVEHPSAFRSHLDVLRIWKGHSIPQPAVFFSREAWERSGPMDVDEHLVLDYDLFCRMSRDYRFHFVDQPLATYRLHDLSKTQGVDDARRLEEAVRVSRKYWGNWFQARRWRLETSFRLHRFDRRRRAVRWLLRAREDWREGRALHALLPALAATMAGPDVFLDTVVMPGLRSSLGPRQGRIHPLRLWRGRDRPETTGWRTFRGIHSDGWAGPELVSGLEAVPGDRDLVLSGTVNWRSSTRIDVFVDGRHCGSRTVKRRAEFSIRMPVASLAPGPHEIRITSSTWFVPDEFLRNGDFRPLAFQVAKLAFEPAPSPDPAT
jgi:glycosyltransferase involved in cell wall biosynthesis